MVARNPNSGRDEAVITSQARKIITSVYQYFRSLNRLEHKTVLQHKTAGATGVSVQAVENILNYHEDERLESLPPPKKTHSPITGNIEGIEDEGIRRVILSFYECGEVPILGEVLERLKEPPFKFSGVESTLKCRLKKLGFCCKCIRGERVMLVEKNDIVAERSKFCRVMFANRNSDNPRPEIYVGETSVSVSMKYLGNHKWKNRNERLVVLHAGGNDGFVHKALKLLKVRSESKRGDTNSLNCKRFREWFQNKLLRNIPPHSLIVMDSSSYHSKILNELPTRYSKKSEITEFLSQMNIDHDSSQTRSELLQLAALHKGKQKYEVDELAREKGHTVVRIPHFHKLLNPIELIWAHVKSQLSKAHLNSFWCLKGASKIPVSVMDVISKSLKDIVKTITKEDWVKFIDYAREMEEDYRSKDRAFESMVEQCADMDDDEDF